MFASLIGIVINTFNAIKSIISSGFSLTVSNNGNKDSIIINGSNNDSQFQNKNRNTK